MPSFISLKATEKCRHFLADFVYSVKGNFHIFKGSNAALAYFASFLKQDLL